MIIHAVTVAELRALLAELNDDDVLVPNKVMNLAIYRSEVYVGFVDLLEDRAHVEMFDEAEVK